VGSDDLVDGDALAVGGLHRALEGLGALDLEADDRRGDLFGSVSRPSVSDLCRERSPSNRQPTITMIGDIRWRRETTRDRLMTPFRRRRWHARRRG
jgi:hypothetical protein